MTAPVHLTLPDGVTDGVRPEAAEAGRGDTGWQCRDAAKSFDGRVVLSGATFSCRQGQVTAIIGQNGAGKSTLFRAAVGLLQLDSGQVLVAGQPAGTDGSRRRIAFTPEHPDLYSGLSVWEHLVFIAVAHRLHRWRPRAEALLESFRLGGHRDALPHQLSQGLRRRLALVMALLRGADVLLLDEPFNGLDPRSSAELRQVMRALAGRGVCVVFASHLLADVGRMADHVVVLHGGRARAQGSVPEVAGIAGLPPDAELESAYLRLTGDPDSVPGMVGTDPGYPPRVRAGLPAGHQ